MKQFVSCLLTHSKGAGSYSGHRVWYFPATNKEFKGQINLEQRIKEILAVDKIPEDKLVYLESCMHYRRFYPHRSRWLKWIWFRLYYKMYRSPIQRWSLKDGNKWVLVPDFLSPQVPYDFDTCLLKRSPESKTVIS